MTLLPYTTLENVTYASADLTIVAVDEGGVITAIGQGTTVITVTAGEKIVTCKVSVLASESSDQQTNVVVDVKPIDPSKPSAEMTVGVSDAGVKDVLYETTNQIIQDVVNQEPITSVDKETIKNLQAALQNNQTVFTEVKTEMLAEMDVHAQIKDLVEQFVGKQATKETAISVAQYFDLSVLLKTDDTLIGTINEIQEPISFTLLLPEHLYKEGRTFYVLRIHEGTVEKLDTILHEDGKLTFQTNRFSTYVLIYEDSAASTEQMESDETVHPNTGEKNAATDYVAMSLCSLFVAGAFFYLKKTSR